MQGIHEGYIQLLRNQVVFQGKGIFEGGLRMGLKYHENSGECDSKAYMDV